jgi:serine/threonine protein kinase
MRRFQARYRERLWPGRRAIERVRISAKRRRHQRRVCKSCMIAPHTIIGGRYRVVKLLGGGGMKLVYLAEDLRLAARKCALAEMVDTFTSAEAQNQAISAFQREADMLAQLSNEHIPRVFDRFSEGNHHFLVMEYIDGVTLEDRIKHNGGKLPSDQVVDIALQVLDTLDYLHHLEPPVIYRDLKPSNIMITADGQAKLIDFGIARHFRPLSNATMIGTQGYAPPEQYRGKAETRSDIYALGATMHHAISGRDPAAEPPFSFPPLLKICPDLEPRLAALIDRALAYDVARRLPSAAEFKRNLLAIKNESPHLGAGVPAYNNQNLKSQLKLPLGDISSNPTINLALGEKPGLTPTGQTILSATTEISCPRCARHIPADSHFCSYCAVDLRVFTALPHAATPGDETVLLSGGHSPGNLSRTVLGTHPPLNPTAKSRRRNGFRRPFLVLALIFAAGFLAAELIRSISRTDNPVPPGYGTGPGEESGEMPRAHAAVPPDEDSDSEDYNYSLPRSRLAELRHRLDAQGYSAVRFRLEGGTLVLYGKVPSEYDRLTVQAICLATVGLTPLNDQITVTGEDSED